MDWFLEAEAEGGGWPWLVYNCLVTLVFAFLRVEESVTPA